MPNSFRDWNFAELTLTLNDGSTVKIPDDKAIIDILDTWCSRDFNYRYTNNRMINAASFAGIMQKSSKITGIPL